jgi:hypothetical protein
MLCRLYRSGNDCLATHLLTMYVALGTLESGGNEAVLVGHISPSAPERANLGSARRHSGGDAVVNRFHHRLTAVIRDNGRRG